MNSYKYLLKNIGILTISNFGTKILSFVLIPMYTRILTTEQFGVYDFYSTTVSLAAPILTLTIVNGVMRFCLDDSYSKPEVFTIGLKQELKAMLLFMGIIVMNSCFIIIPLLNQFPVFLVTMFVSLRCYIFLSQFSRGMGRFFDLAVAGAINSVIMFFLNIIFLLCLKTGLKGYFMANIFANIVPSIYLFLRVRAWQYIKWKDSDPMVKYEMLQYSKPMVFSSLGWWINNASDRYIVTWICGVSANGVYSLAYKIPSILSIIQNIFNQAWALSAVREINDNSEKFYTDIYIVYNCVMVIICSFIIAIDKIIASLLFAKDFFLAWQYAPFLMISTVFGALIGLLEGVFLAAKKTDIIAKTTCLGAGINTLLNFSFIHLLGPLGAAIATLFSYMVVWLIRLTAAKKIISLTINIKRDLFSYLVLFIQSAFLFLDLSYSIFYIVQLIAFILIVALYKDNLNLIIKKLNLVSRFHKQ